MPAAALIVVEDPSTGRELERIDEADR